MGQGIPVGGQDGPAGRTVVPVLYFCLQEGCIFFQKMVHKYVFHEFPGQLQGGVAVHIQDFPVPAATSKGQVEGPVDPGNGVVRGGPGFPVKYRVRCFGAGFSAMV